MRKILDVDCGPSGHYPVLFGEDAAGSLVSVWNGRWKQAAIIADSNTSRLFARAFRLAADRLVPYVVELSFPAGERSKTRRTKERLEQEMLEAGLDRSACVIALGGGVVLDLAGFVAATYMRGIPHVNVPTTLLAQVDASIGGKTGVNTPAGKNLIGAFHQPKAVLIDPTVLKTLPLRERRAGLAEVIKQAVVADAELFSGLESWNQTTSDALLPDTFLQRSVAIKAAVVQEDLRDVGRRQILNFGHTAAHAIENATGHRVRHGDAVASGMIVEGMLARSITGFPDGDLKRLRELIRSSGLPIHPQCAFDDALPSILRDKKSSEGTIRCALPDRIGGMPDASGAWTVSVTNDQLRAAWDEAQR